MNDPNDGTWTYEYDCGGNILNKKQYAYTTGTLGTVQQIVSYAYGDADWKDKLTRYNGVDIACDAIGNPIHDGVWAYTWENGRQLRRMACDATIAEFVYNADGLRVQKTVNGVATNYTLHGKNIVHMTKGNAELHFWYDTQNRPAIVEFNGTKYGYLYNLQGDVIGLIDGANNEVVRYTYDAWGKPLSVTGSLANTIGYYNPFRYRGYVYDVETGLYYLRSRYYNPSWGRFVNADAVITENLYVYCKNAIINKADHDGNWGTNSTAMPTSFLISQLLVMLEDGLNKGTRWKYAPGQRYRRVDCISMICYCAEQYLTKDAFGKNGFFVRKGTRKAIESNVNEKEFFQISSDSLPSVGSIVYNADNSHVGVYLGYVIAPNGMVYKNGVVQSSPNKGVHIAELEDTGFVKYCTFNYIVYDLAPGMGIEFPLSRYTVMTDDGSWDF